MRWPPSSSCRSNIKVPNSETRAAMEEARAMTRARFTNAGR